jgi:hypothetical protein
MQILPSTKYTFRIKTRNGATVDNLLIPGKDQAEAERKLRQIYLGCEIIEARRQADTRPRSGQMTYEELLDLISAG